MSKITINKDKYFLKTLEANYFPFKGEKKEDYLQPLEEAEILIPIGDIVDVEITDELAMMYPYYLVIKYFKRATQTCYTIYKTKQERDEDWEKLKNLERIK